MISISTELKRKALEALMAKRRNFDGPDAAFAKSWGINKSCFSQLKQGKTHNIISDSTWLNIIRELEVGENCKKWETARTDVFNTIEEDVLFCQENSKSRIFVDECEIGKTHAVKYLSRTLKNCFYVDASQAKTRTLFVRKLAKTIGVDHLASYSDVKENIKYYLKLLPFPIVIIDEAGDLEYQAFLELKEFWNATDGACGWYMVGADGLRDKIERGIRNKKVGFRELFSRFSNRYSSAVPSGTQRRIAFYRKLIADVLEVNMEDKTKMEAVIRKCIVNDEEANIGGLRRAESILSLTA